jgi:hypothetical protein
MDEDVGLSPGRLPPLRVLAHVNLRLDADPAVLAPLRHRSMAWLGQSGGG